MPCGGRTASIACSGNGMLNGPYSLPRKPAVWNAFAQIEPLADVDEGGHRVGARPQRSRDHGAEVRGGDRLRRRVAGMPMVLVAGVQDEAEVGAGIGSDQR